MSIVAILMALLLISTHACNARRAPYGIHENGNTKSEHDSDIESLLTIENTKDTFSGDIQMSMGMRMLDKHQSTFQTEGLERKERSMEEDETHEEEASNRKDEEAVEDAVVMDYVTPHRKSPIHNHYEVDLP